MNVLVYSGPEVIQTSLNHALASLKHILLPNYTVQAITQNALTTQPWQGSCALLVLPRSRCRFVSVANKYIKEFVEGGGAYLMLSTDATAIPRSQGLGLGSVGLSLGLEAGESPLKFYDKLNNVYILCDEEAPSAGVEPRAVTLRSADGAVAQGVYETTATQFKGFAELKDIFVLARNNGAIAGVVLGIDKGRAAFWGPSIEYPLSNGPAGSTFTTEEIAASDKIRSNFLANTLSQLGLTLPREEDKQQVIARPLPQFLSGTPGKPAIVTQIMDAIASTPQLGSQITLFTDENDEFHFHALAESADLLESTRKAARVPSDPATWQPKHIVVCPDNALPPTSATPLFDIALFFAALASAREAAALPAQGAGAVWGMGEALIYGEAVTSTQTMLDK
ncbi:hypothetical protein HYPSUDRAFT_65936 [Hypholoma sublateritium FD-334 SS-4]|uniref:Biotin-protein ligase N-terminal domain-containing protein n=1 Tax=Hypholoma sublateritium (strain FD-334 SS-4) TaxID=945553 RepID=A0A0D2PWF1_HYPSF|nr:hypothetical protein HYPSUDRAFT_65936 [Hypholoma sublateritium FD-334 SS-4]